MTPLVLALLSAAPCFTVQDSKPGWKQVTLPDNAPQLAAPVGIEQFRSDDLVEIVDERDQVFLEGETMFPGKTSFEFPLGPGAKSLEVRLAHPLRGAKVDVLATSSEGSLRLMDEQRIGGDVISLTWGASDVSSVRVVFHEHLRQSPRVQGWKVVRLVSWTAVHPSDAFKLPKSLYFRQPAGAPLVLCQDAAVHSQVRQGSPAPQERPVPVTLRPAPMGP